MADDPRLHPFAELTGITHGRRSWSRTSTRTTTRSSSTPRAPPGSRRAPSPPTGAWSPTSRTRCSTLSPDRWWRPPAGAAAPSPTPAGQNVSLFTSPLFHVSGCHSTLVVGLLAGLKLVMPEGRFLPETALQLIQDHKVTVWATVPTMVWRVCEHPDRHDYDTSSVKSVAFGGSPSADELQRMIHDTFPNVSSTSNAYGLTETSSVATVISGQDALDKPTSVGPARADREGEDRRRRRHGPRPGRDRRGVHHRPDPHGRLLEQARGHRRGDRRGGLAAHRRRRPPRRGRLPVHHRPEEGHAHPGRREHLLRGDRAAPRRPPGHRRRRHHRRAPPRARRRR